ncbi:MAG: hypothetical protein HY545_00850 [Candidatus Doudnabacteria bacterium]|nr:hypothetical protein [Candidatus Doudnabacteria bacterium]
MHRHHVDVYLLLKVFLKSIAREAAYLGDNHRDFLVGCAILAYNGHEYGIFWGANFMPFTKPGPKICAEINALRNTRRAGFQEIIAIVVAGLPQKDEVTGKTPRTLPPCVDCRSNLSGWKGVSPDTMIYTVHRFEEVEEERTFAHLLEEYALS